MKMKFIKIEKGDISNSNKVLKLICILYKIVTLFNNHPETLFWRNFNLHVNKMHIENVVKQVNRRTYMKLITYIRLVERVCKFCTCFGNNFFSTAFISKKCRATTFKTLLKHHIIRIHKTGSNESAIAIS